MSVDSCPPTPPTSKLNAILDEALQKLLSVKTETIRLTGRVVPAYNEDDLIDKLRGIVSYPAIGVVYEGMRSQPSGGETEKTGVSCEVVLSFVLIEQGPTILASDQKRVRAIDYLDVMRDQFMNKRCMASGHKWHFLVEAPAEIKAGMVCWVQRWSVPAQFPPKP